MNISQPKLRSEKFNDDDDDDDDDNNNNNNNNRNFCEFMACIISATDYIAFVKGCSVSYCGSDGELSVQTVATEGNRKIRSLN